MPSRRGGNWHGGSHGGHYYGHSHFGGSVFIGWPWYWWGPVAYGYPAYYYDYPYYSYPSYYDSTEVYVEPPAGGTVTPAPAPQPKAQYYCPDSGYYPSVQTCPRGWLRVVPGAPPQS